MSSCIECKYHNKKQWVTCNAFPDGIPFDILNGEFDHNKKHDGDNGIQFEPIKKGNVNSDIIEHKKLIIDGYEARESMRKIRSHPDYPRNTECYKSEQDTKPNA